jgi:hypothetical protein
MALSNAMVVHTLIIERFHTSTKSRWLIGGDLLTDPDTRDDQRNEDLANKSISALPPISVSGRLVGKYRLYYPEYKEKSRIRGRKMKILPRKSDYESY